MERAMQLIRSLAMLVLFTCLAFAQAPHSVTLNWTDTQNPPGTTYVYRSATACAQATTFTSIASSLTTLTYVDSTVTVGKYCYQVTASLNGLESLPSNQTDAKVLPFAPTQGTPTVK